MATPFDGLIRDLKDAVGTNSKETFQSLLLQTVKLLDLSDEKIAERFDSSRPTVNRWRSGANAPHQALRPAVYEWLLELAEARAVRYAKAELQEAEAEVQRSKRPKTPSYSETAIAARSAK